MGTYRLRQGLTARAAIVLAPAHVTDGTLRRNPGAMAAKEDSGNGEELRVVGDFRKCAGSARARFNQAEIDSLLGFESAAASGQAGTGIEKIISSGLVSYERLPMLEIVFDRLVQIMSASLVSSPAINVEVGIDNILSLRLETT